MTMDDDSQCELDAALDGARLLRERLHRQDILILELCAALEAMTDIADGSKCYNVPAEISEARDVLARAQETT